MALAMSLACLAAYHALFLFRSGLGDDIGQVWLMGILSLAPIWAPVAALSFAGKGAADKAVAITASLVLSQLIPMIGLVSGAAAIALAAAVICAGLVFGAVWQSVVRHALLILGLGLALTFLFLAFVPPAGLFLPEIILQGVAPTDIYKFTALAQMVRFYHVVSMGADGLLYYPYHTLSNVLAAGYAAASGAEVQRATLYWCQIGMPLGLFWCAMVAGMFLFPVPGTASAAICFRIAYACLGCILTGSLDSYSFVLGEAFLLAALPVLTVLLRSEAGAAASGTAILVAVALASALIAATAKVSAGFMCALALMLVAWKYRARPVVAASLVMGLLLLLVVVKTWLLEKDAVTGGLPWYFFFLDYYNLITVQTATNYAVPALTALLLMERVEVPRPALADVAKTGAWFLRQDAIAQFNALMVLACLTVLIFLHVGGNNTFFSAMMCGASFLFLPIALTEGKRPSLNLPRIPAAPVALLLSALVVFRAATDIFGAGNIMQTISARYQQAFKDKGVPFPNGETTRQITASLKATHRPFSSLEGLIQASSFARLQADLNAKAQPDPRAFAVHIPPDADEMWHSLESTGQTGWWCFAGHLTVPAITGFFEIRSIAPKNQERSCLAPGLPVYYSFGAEQEAHRSIPLSDGELCALARRWGARRVYRLRSYRHLSENRVVDCRD